MINLSVQNDEWITSYREGNPIWIATLDDGLDVFRDDGRWPNAEHSAWVRLREFCRREKRAIRQLRFGFRSNMFSIVDDAEGYFFSLGIRGIYPHGNQHFWKIGYVDGNDVNIRKWFVPEMLPDESEVRPKIKCFENLVPGTGNGKYL